MHKKLIDGRKSDSNNRCIMALFSSGKCCRLKQLLRVRRIHKLASSSLMQLFVLISSPIPFPKKSVTFYKLIICFALELHLSFKNPDFPFNVFGSCNSLLPLRDHCNQLHS